MSTPLDGRLIDRTQHEDNKTYEVSGIHDSATEYRWYDDPSANATAQYADEEEHIRDHYPRRCRGILPEQRKWWIPGMKAAIDTLTEAHSGWKAIGVGMLAVASCISCMDAGGGGTGIIRHLRAWGPGQQARIPFSRWVREVTIWSVANSDMNEFRQAAYVSSRVTGMAREYVDEWPPGVLIQGGGIHGNPVPPMTFLMHSLAERWPAGRG